MLMANLILPAEFKCKCWESFLPGSSQFVASSVSEFMLGMYCWRVRRDVAGLRWLGGDGVLVPAVLVMGLQRKRRAAKGQISGPEGTDEVDRILQNRKKADDKSRGDQRPSMGRSRADQRPCSC